MIHNRIVGGRYLLLTELERDGFGPCYRAEDRITGRHVAVTEIRLPDEAWRAQPDPLRERLLREVRAAGRIRHPGVVPVHDLVADRHPDGFLREHLVTELPEARTLAALVAEAPLPPRRVAAIGRDLLAALGALHESGIVHGGLTPDCVLVDAAGRAMVTDIGLERAIGPRPDADPGAFVAPERGAGAPDSPAADLWSLGAVLHHAAGRRPPPAGPLTETITGLTAAEPADRLTPADAGALLERAARPVPAAGDLGRSRTFLLAVAAVLLAAVVVLVVLNLT